MMKLKTYQKYLLASMYGPEDYKKIVDGMRKMNFIKEDDDMPTDSIKTIKFEWDEKRPADYYAEVWAFMKETDAMTADDFYECFGSGKEVFDIFSNFEEAKKTLDEYKKNREVHAGDYVKIVYPNEKYEDYDILVIDTYTSTYGGGFSCCKCVAAKKHSSILAGTTDYKLLDLATNRVKKTGKKCKNFNYAMYTLFEDC